MSIAAPLWLVIAASAVVALAVVASVFAILTNGFTQWDADCWIALALLLGALVLIGFVFQSAEDVQIRIPHTLKFNYMPFAENVGVSQFASDPKFKGFLVDSRDYVERIKASQRLELNRCSFVVKRTDRNNSCEQRDPGQYPVRPDRRIVSEPPPLKPSARQVLPLFLFGACAFGLGVLFAYRSQFVGEHPEIALILLSGYVCIVIGLSAWLGDHLR